jgi:hypothetical protein
MASDQGGEEEAFTSAFGGGERALTFRLLALSPGRKTMWAAMGKIPRMTHRTATGSVRPSRREQVAPPVARVGWFVLST